jgi:hypothetical protein
MIESKVIKGFEMETLEEGKMRNILNGLSKDRRTFFMTNGCKVYERFEDCTNLTLYAFLEYSTQNSPIGMMI